MFGSRISETVHCTDKKSGGSATALVELGCPVAQLTCHSSDTMAACRYGTAQQHVARVHQTGCLLAFTSRKLRIYRRNGSARITGTTHWLRSTEHPCCTLAMKLELPPGVTPGAVATPQRRNLQYLMALTGSTIKVHGKAQPPHVSIAGGNADEARRLLLLQFKQQNVAGARMREP